jgi:hypothetical protein
MVVFSLFFDDPRDIVERKNRRQLLGQLET